MNKERIGILDYGAGNFGSVRRALEALSVQPVAVRTVDDFSQIDRLIFPGVGSAEQAMLELNRRGLSDALRAFADSGRPLLGICVGMQVLGRWSAEGNIACLGLLPYRIEKFDCPDPVPHMGWNSLDWHEANGLCSVARHDLADAANFYFVHSYAAFLDADTSKETFLIASCRYGGRQFAALVGQGNVWGAQCHVEKSGRAGLAFIKNFLEMSARSC